MRGIDYALSAGMKTTAAAKATRYYGNPGDVITGTCRKTGRTWTAVVGQSGRIVGKTFSA